MSQAEGSGQSAQLRVISRRGIIHNLDFPVILSVSNGKVTVARHLPISLGDRSGDLVRVKVAASLGVNKTDDIAVADVSNLLILGVVVRLLSVGVEEPVVVGVLVMVAGNLLLGGAFRVGLHVRVQKTATVTHVLERCTGSDSNFQRAILANFSSPKVGLEERRHLCIAWSAVLQDEEVDVEREKVDNEGNDNKADNSEGKVCGKLDL
jgi:hypothetical protein